MNYDYIFHLEFIHLMLITLLQYCHHHLSEYYIMKIFIIHIYFDLLSNCLVFTYYLFLIIFIQFNFCYFISQDYDAIILEEVFFKKHIS